MATRKQIREAVKARISSAFNTVYSSWRNQVDPRDFPCAMVYFEGGQPEGVFGNYETEALITVEIWEHDASNLDDALDLLGNQTKALIEQDDTLAGVIDGMVLNNFDYDRDPDSFAGMLTLTFNVTYQDED